MTITVYYLTGMNGQLAKGLGEALLNRGVQLTGRELVGDFKRLNFQEQIDAVCDDLVNHFWSEYAHIVANSFGAYLFLHAQAKLNKPFDGKVLLLSPIVGEFSNDQTQMNFIPPRSTYLHEVAQRGDFPRLMNCEIHVGSEDWQSNPKNVQNFAELVGINYHIVKNDGHMLSKEYVGSLLDRWLVKI